MGQQQDKIQDKEKQGRLKRGRIQTKKRQDRRKTRTQTRTRRNTRLLLLQKQE